MFFPERFSSHVSACDETSQRAKRFGARPEDLERDRRRLAQLARQFPGAVHAAANHRKVPTVVYAILVLPPGAPPEVSAPIPAACR